VVQKWPGRSRTSVPTYSKEAQARCRAAAVLDITLAPHMHGSCMNGATPRHAQELAADLLCCASRGASPHLPASKVLRQVSVLTGHQEDVKPALLTEACCHFPSFATVHAGTGGLGATQVGAQYAQRAEHWMSAGFHQTEVESDSPTG